MASNTCSPFPSFIELTPSRYGRMFYPRHDRYVGGSFRDYGEFSEGEVGIFTHFVQRGAIVLVVEGFESRVLEGAAATIERCRPTRYVENDREEKSAELIQLLFDMGYQLWWHTPLLFNPSNFKCNPENAFPGICSVNMLAMHRDRPFKTDLRQITTTADRGW